MHHCIWGFALSLTRSSSHCCMYHTIYTLYISLFRLAMLSSQIEWRNSIVQSTKKKKTKFLFSVCVLFVPFGICIDCIQFNVLLCAGITSIWVIWRDCRWPHTKTVLMHYSHTYSCTYLASVFNALASMYTQISLFLFYAYTFWPSFFG